MPCLITGGYIESDIIRPLVPLLQWKIKRILKRKSIRESIQLVLSAPGSVDCKIGNLLPAPQCLVISCDSTSWTFWNWNHSDNARKLWKTGMSLLHAFSGILMEVRGLTSSLWRSTEEWTIPLWVVILLAATAVFGTSKHDTAHTPTYFVWKNNIHVPNHQPVVRWVYHMFIHWFFDAIWASSSVWSDSSSLTLGTYRIAACLWSSPGKNNSGKRLTGASASHLKQNAKDIGDHHSKWDTVENKQLLSNICNQPVDDGAFSKIQQYQ